MVGCIDRYYNCNMISIIVYTYSFLSFYLSSHLFIYISFYLFIFLSLLLSFFVTFFLSSFFVTFFLSFFLSFFVTFFLSYFLSIIRTHFLIFYLLNTALMERGFIHCVEEQPENVFNFQNTLIKKTLYQLTPPRYVRSFLNGILEIKHAYSLLIN